MSLPNTGKSEKNDSLSIPEILADFFLRKIDMPSHSDDSEHKHKNKRKKSKHKKRKHKKSKHRRQNRSSDSSSRGSDLNTKGVDDVSSSEEMGIQRLKKIKNMKLQSVTKGLLQTVSVPDNHQTKDKNDPSNSSKSENLVFYGPSLELLLSGVEPSNSASKIDTVANTSSDCNKNIDPECDLNKNENSVKNDSDPTLSRQNDSVISSDLSIPLPVDNKVEPERILHNVPISNENTVVNDNNDTNKSNSAPLKTSCDNILNQSASAKSNIKKDYKNSEKSISDIKQSDSHVVDKQKSDDKKKKHSRSRSSSKSRTKHSSPKSKHRKKTSRSSSKDSYHSHRKRKRHSRSRSHSQGKLKSHDHKKRSHSRSRSRSRYVKHKKHSRSRSPRERHNHRRQRSRSQSYTRQRRHSDSRTRRRSRSRHRERSLSKSRYKSKSSRRSASRSRSRSKSKSKQNSHSKEKSRSRSKSKERKGSQSNTKIDQAKILETARKNVLKMMKNGTLPEGLPVENLKKGQLLSIQAGGKSVQELTDFCQRLSQKENDPDYSDNEDKDDKPDDETGFIHHPFKVKEPGMIKLNIKNAVQLPIKTHAQKVAETARLSSQFPVSSGNQHKQKELEWIPVVPVSKNSETKPIETNVSTNTNTNKTIEVVSKTPVSSVPPPISSIPMPISYPSSSSETPKVEVPVVVSPLAPPPIPPPPLPPPLQPPIQSPALFQIPIQPVMASYVLPNQEMMNSYASTSTPVQPSSSVFKPPKKLDIPAIVTKRFQALTKLKQYPNDLEALKVVHETQESIQEWVESQQVPGLFTGSTDAKMLTVAELSGPKYHKFRKKIDLSFLLIVL